MSKITKTTKEECPIMLTISEAMANTRLSRGCILRMMEEGRIKYIRMGRKHFINQESLNAYLSGANDKERD